MKEEKTKEFNLNEYNAWDRLYFKYVGMYPIETTSKLRRIFHYIKCVLTISSFVILLLSMTAGLAFEASNIAEIAELLYYWITFCAFIPKAIWFVYKGKELVQLEEHLSAKISYKYYKIFGHEMLDPNMRAVKFLAMTYRLCVTFFCSYVTIQPLFQPEARLPFPGWMPFDTVKYRSIAYPLQVICVTASAIADSSLDIYTAICMSIGAGQLLLFKTCLRNIDYSDKPQSEKIKHGKLGPECLKDMVTLYQHIIDYLQKVENIFSFSFFIQFLATIGVICFTGFELLIISPNDPAFMLLISYFIAMVSQILLYCWYGNEILYESESIGLSCYMSNWYEATTSQKRILSIIVERAKRPLKLLGGKFFILSLSTLMMMVKSSYSYFAVLRQYYKDKDIFGKS